MKFIERLPSHVDPTPEQMLEVASKHHAEYAKIKEPSSYPLRWAANTQSVDRFLALSVFQNPHIPDGTMVLCRGHRPVHVFHFTNVIPMPVRVEPLDI